MGSTHVCLSDFIWALLWTNQPGASWRSGTPCACMWMVKTMWFPMSKRSASSRLHYSTYCLVLRQVMRHGPAPQEVRHKWKLLLLCEKIWHFAKYGMIQVLYAPLTPKDMTKNTLDYFIHRLRTCTSPAVSVSGNFWILITTVAPGMF